MARKTSYVPLKSKKPKWYCINKPHGKLQSLVAYSKPLFYVTDPREMKGIKRMLGNPKFFDEYDYLLVSKNSFGDFEDIFGVIANSQNGNKNVAAFVGDVEKVMYGWTFDKRHYDAIVGSAEDSTCGLHGEPCDEDELETYPGLDDEID
ncbi:MAG TPA: hypothetical protein PLW50_00220 [Smithellaceae bacterium]|nr:hypothetical protein [Smithellaceae bacterium]